MKETQVAGEGRIEMVLEKMKSNDHSLIIFCTRKERAHTCPTLAGLGVGSQGCLLVMTSIFFFFLYWSQGYQLAPINEKDLLEAIEERAEGDVWFSLSREELIYSENTDGLPDSLKAPRVARHRVV